MADYFAALAARTLRPELGVQPRQRVRWEDDVKAMALFRPAMSKPIPDGREPGATDSHDTSRRVRRVRAAEQTQPEHEQVEAPRKRTAPARHAAGVLDAPTAAMPPAPHPTVRAVEPTVQVPPPRMATSTGHAPGGSAADAGDHGETPARNHRTQRVHPLSTRLAAPERASEPAIRIHIGRVDVRAVMPGAQPASPAAARDKRALMSIDEYVQKRDRGTS